MNNKNDNKVRSIITQDSLIVVGIVVMILVVVSVGSYAYVTWRGEDTSGGLTTIIGDLATITFEKGVNLSSSNLSPVLSYEDGIYSTFNINKKIDDDVDMKFYLTVNSIDEELKDEALKYILFASSDNNNFDNIASGSFDAVVDSRLNIIEGYRLATQVTYYRLYIYLDGRMDNNNMIGKSLDVILNIGAETVSDDIENEVVDENLDDTNDNGLIDNSGTTSQVVIEHAVVEDIIQ